MDRIVDNWRPQYKAAKREHQELVERIDATRELWPEYLEGADFSHPQTGQPQAARGNAAVAG